jgi:hypothetical protein
MFEYSEADLHPFLTYYARTYFRAYTKTIHHNKSTKKVSAGGQNQPPVGESNPAILR